MQISKKDLEEMIIQEIKLRDLDGLPTIDPNAAEQKVLPPVGANPLVAILRGLSRGITDTMKEDMAIRILEHLEIDPNTPVAKVFINFIGNLSFDDLVAIIMGANRCPAIASELGDALAETIIEAIPETLGINPQGHMARIMREALATTLAEELGAKITEALCNIDFSDLLDDIPGGRFLKRLLFRE